MSKLNVIKLEVVDQCKLHKPQIYLLLSAVDHLIFYVWMLEHGKIICNLGVQLSNLHVCRVYIK